jgi:type III pantothenate kinase
VLSLPKHPNPLTTVLSLPKHPNPQTTTLHTRLFLTFASMTNLILDQGNTRLKAALFKEGILARKTFVSDISVEALKLFLKNEEVDGVMISSVAGDDLYQQLRPVYGDKLFLLSHELPLPFQSVYTTPATLGLDRIALAAAALAKFSKQDCLVIDAGTCITYDFIDQSKVYHGGAISPGMQMRYQSLAHYTAKLPEVEHQAPNNLIGDSTVNSIRSGVVNGIIHEMKGTIAAYKERFPEVQVLITGGDLNVFEPLLKNGIFADPDFLLFGLNNILEYYAEVL